VLKAKCDICKIKKLEKDSAQLYVDSHLFNVCDECEMLLAVITDKVNEREKNFGDIEINEQPI
jgi:hypothetical protein